ncbi:MAG TPA: hypothetical protein VFD01_17050 [Candidatus Dormibacteraeota bacterium]|nr:hypothetical protein [Candidatus Dormibacteraeota bacterium]
MLRGWTRWVMVALSLIALYLLLEHAAQAAQVISTIGAGTMALFGTLQGRNVTAYGETIGAST